MDGHLQNHLVVHTTQAAALHAFKSEVRDKDKSQKSPEDPPPHKLIAQLISEEIKERSRRFSQLPPAPVESPDAVKMGSKFTMIPTDANR